MLCYRDSFLNKIIVYYVDQPLTLSPCHISFIHLYMSCYRSLQSTPPIEEDSWRHRRLRSELKTLRTDPPEGIQATPLDRHCCHWQASITGPHGSPYEGGLFLLYLQIPHRSVSMSAVSSCSTFRSHTGQSLCVVSSCSTFRSHTGQSL